MFPNKSPTSISFVIIILLGLWSLSGFYRVGTDEQGVVTRFGEYVRTTEPGLHYHLPFPIETVGKPKVTKVNRIEVGFRTSQSQFSQTPQTRQTPEEALMLTGDENIVDINYSVFWVIKDAGKFLFNIQSPIETVKPTSETAMREVIAKNEIQTILTEGDQILRWKFKKSLNKF
jgi:membrane protease subunit HflK